MLKCKSNKNLYLSGAVVLGEIYNVIILFLFSMGYGFYNYSNKNFVDIGKLTTMSLLFGLGVFCIIKSFQYLINSEKTIAKIIKRNSRPSVTTRHSMGSYSRGYRYDFLIDNKEYTMHKYFHFGSKYEVGDNVKVSIVSREKKIVIPIRAVYNIIIIGVVAIYISYQIAIR